MKIYTIAHCGKEYLIADIPDVITGSESRLLIGSRALNVALYDDEKGYKDSAAEEIDEQIYAYLDDRYFSMEEDDFLSKVKKLLD